MSRRKPASSRASKPLDGPALNALALSYLGRYATTRLKLRQYLVRKLAERGWDGEDQPPVDAVVAHCAALRYVDDAAYAAARGAALGRRGFGERRVAEALRAVGIDADIAAPACAAAREDALAAALVFARRKRIGPFSSGILDHDQRRRNMAALLRAGHAPDISRRIVDALPGAALDES